jgi:predicted nucleotidyltransferase
VYLERIVKVVKKIDPYAEVYLFGSVVEGKYLLLSSDIDILVVTSSPPGNLLAELWASGLRDLFEIHVVNLEVLEVYKKRSKLIRVDDKYK